MADEAEKLYREIPSVDRVLESEEIASWATEHAFGRGFLRRAVNAHLDELREAIAEGELDQAGLEDQLEELADGVARAANRLARPHLRPVINASGVVVHTNLGRSPWSDGAADRVATLTRRYLNLEYDVDEGERGHRDLPVEALMTRLFPGTGTAVVNNNAAAVLLVLNTLAEGREVLVSRGQLVEIGGSFRIPEVMRKGGARLREVGTTNRTRIEDFEAALSDDTALLLAVHPSNYRVVGFTESVPLEELVELGREHGVPVVEDMGSGNLLDLEAIGIREEPTVAERNDTGVDLLTFSGDKLLGGPQSGFILGRPDLVERVRDNPLYRAVRLDKAIYLALEATLTCYITGRESELPTVEMLQREPEGLRRVADSLASRVRDRLEEASVASDVQVEVVELDARVGGGAAPGAKVPSWGLAVVADASPDALAERLRSHDPPVVARIADDRLLLDVRTLLPGEEDPLVDALVTALAGC